MKTFIKDFFIVVAILIVVIILDTLQALAFKNSTFIKKTEKLDKYSYIDKGVIIDTYYCRKDDLEHVTWHLKTDKYECEK